MDHFFIKTQKLLGKGFAPVVILFMSLIIFVLLFEQSQPQQYHFRLNQVAEKTIQAPATLEDQEQTKINRQRAYDSVNDVYSYQPSILESQLVKSELLRSAINEVKRLSYSSKDLLGIVDSFPNLNVETYEIDQVSRSINQRLSFGQLNPTEQWLALYQYIQPKNDSLASDLMSLPSSVITNLLLLNEESLSVVFTKLQRIMNQSLTEEIASNEVSKTINELQGTINQMSVNRDEKNTLESLIQIFIVPTVVYNEQETLLRREKAAEAIQPSYILQGQVIIQEGHIIDSVAMRRLEIFGFLDENNFNHLLYLLLGIIGIHGILLLSIITDKFSWNSYSLVQANRNISLYFCLMVGALVILKALYTAEINGLDNMLLVFPAFVFPYLILSQTRFYLALFSSIWLNLFGIFMIHNLENRTQFMMVTIFLLFSTFTSYLIMKKSNQILNFKTFVIVLLSHMMIGIFSLLMLNNTVTWQKFYELVFFICLNVAFNYLLLILIFPYWESYFSDEASLTLNQLANLNNPILKELIEKAPGTYHHSMMVANLASNAVDALGGNALLTRVASYYHDVGKTLHPLFFVENLLTGMESPHKIITAEESAAIIINHVTDGANMLESNYFPKSVVDICLEHHGTTLVQYFYMEARKKNPNIDVELFKYPGPKPQSKEAAVIMIADSVEAASRSIKDYTSETIANMIDKIIHDKVIQNQFEDCDLTIHELKIVRQSLLNGIASIYHTRIEYPD